MKLKVILSLLICAIFVILSFYNVSWSELSKGLSNYNLVYTFFAIFLFLIIHSLRSLRLKLLLNKMCKIEFSEAFGLNAVGLFAVVLFPWRLGEFVRMYYLSEKKNVRIISTVGIAFIERICDITSIYILFLFFMIFGDTGSRLIPIINISIGRIFWISTYSVFLLLIIFGLIIIVEKKLNMEFLPSFIKNKANKIITYVKEGLRVIPTIKIFFLILFISISLWILSVFVSYIFIKAFPFGANLTIESALFVTILLIIGITIPTAPGFVGNFQFFTKIALMFYGVLESDALAMAIVYHFVNISFHAIIAFSFIGKYPFSLSLLKKRKEFVSN